MQISEKDLDKEEVAPPPSTSTQINEADLDAPQNVSSTRAIAGKAPGPREYTDEQLGLDPGPVKRVLEGPLATGITHALGGTTFNEDMRIPATAADAQSQERLVDLANASAGLDQAKKEIGAMALGGTVAKGVGAIGKGASVLKNALSGAAGAGTTAVASGQSAKEAGVSTVIGAGLGGLMGVVAKRAAEKAIQQPFKDVARAGEQKEKENLLKMGAERVTSTIKKFGIGGVEDPQNALAAVDDGIKRSELLYENALEAVTRPGTSPQILKQAEERLAEHQKDLETLKQIRPILSRLNSKAQLQKTFLERLAAKPYDTARDTLKSIVGLPVQAAAAPFRAADAAIAGLLKAKAQGQLTPDMIQAAVSAGVSPQLLQRITGANSP